LRVLQLARVAAGRPESAALKPCCKTVISERARPTPSTRPDPFGDP
jgi:hypothetical protein